MSEEQNKKEISRFFGCLGEIWRDITAIEFLMRCAIALKDGDVKYMPKPPYIKDKIYKKYPKSFSHYSFELVVNKFNKRFPKIKIPQELIQLRDGMAHGIIAEINKSGIDQIIKFKELKDKSGIKVEFIMSLEIKKLIKIQKSLIELRRHIMKLSGDKK